MTMTGEDMIRGHNIASPSAYSNQDHGRLDQAYNGGKVDGERNILVGMTLQFVPME